MRGRAELAVLWQSGFSCPDVPCAQRCQQAELSPAQPCAGAAPGVTEPCDLQVGKLRQEGSTACQWVLWGRG